jgi:hypothetical protein
LNRIALVASAFLVCLASLPLSALAADHGFGLAATLTVPTCCCGFWLALISPLRADRIGWFAFASIGVLLLPACPLWQQIIEFVLNVVQDSIRTSQSTLLYQSAETIALLSMIVLPWVAGCVLGWLVAKFTRRFLADPDRNEEDSEATEYRFTIRGMLMSIAVCGALLAWISTTVARWQTREETNRELFLQRFTESFTTDNMRLAAEPEISEDHVLFGRLGQGRGHNSAGISEYRVTAPIEKNGLKRWAVWTYLCDERYPGTVSKFGYAETATPAALPPFPFPVAQYLREPIYPMVNGEPPLATRLQIIAAPTVVKAGDTITIVAQTDRSLQCDLVIRPAQAVAIQPLTMFAPPSGVVRWDVQLEPQYQGSKFPELYAFLPGSTYL